MSTEDVFSTVVHKTETGYRFKRGGRWVEVSDTEALALWIAFGLLIDRGLQGQLNAATSGGLDALRRAFNKQHRNKTGD